MQARFEQVIEEAAEVTREAHDGLLSGPTVTTGDEFQVLFQVPVGVQGFIVRVTDAMYPTAMRFGLGLGTLETDVREEAVGMDGPCFHNAREALETADADDAWLRIQGFGQGFDPSINAIADLVASVRGDWTDRQQEFAVAYRELGIQQAVAERFDVSKSTVSESLSGAHVKEVRDAERAISHLLAEATKQQGASG